MRRPSRTRGGRHGHHGHPESRLEIDTLEGAGMRRSYLLGEKVKGSSHVLPCLISSMNDITTRSMTSTVRPMTAAALPPKSSPSRVSWAPFGRIPLGLRRFLQTNLGGGHVNRTPTAAPLRHLQPLFALFAAFPLRSDGLRTLRPSSVPCFTFSRKMSPAVHVLRHP